GVAARGAKSHRNVGRTARGEASYPSSLQGDTGVYHLEAHALIVALRAAAGESRGGGQIAALGERFVDAGGDQFAVQTAAAATRDRAVGKERGQIGRASWRERG